MCEVGRVAVVAVGFYFGWELIIWGGLFLGVSVIVSIIVVIVITCIISIVIFSFSSLFEPVVLFLHINDLLGIVDIVYITIVVIIIVVIAINMMFVHNIDIMPFINLQWMRVNFKQLIMFMLLLLIIILPHTLCICLIDLPRELWLWTLIIDDVTLAIRWPYSLSTGVYYISRLLLYERDRLLLRG